MYNKRLWVNPESCPSTGSVVAYHGPVNWGRSDEKRGTESFFEVSDCHQKARLHRCKYDSMDEFIKKVEAVRDIANDFSIYLKSINDKDNQ